MGVKYGQNLNGAYAIVGESIQKICILYTVQRIKRIFSVSKHDDLEN